MKLQGAKVKICLIALCVAGMLQASFAQSLKASKTIKQDSVYLDFINLFSIPVEVNLSGKDSLGSEVRFKPYTLLHANETLKEALVIPLKSVKDTAQIQIEDYINFKATFGSPFSKEDGTRYILPYLKGMQYEIMQSYGGAFSHKSTSSYYAIDFSLQVGDTVTAARDGVVFFVKEDSKEHCPTPKCIDKANKILISHKDGTYANYVHLDYEGALVNVGDTIKAGDMIGISGMTGFTTKPHLHFVVHKARSVSVPIRFKGVWRKKLKQGKLYRRKR
ncbi:M23 family metallopeptidase [Psychroflexus sp. YR1-1]|uniref:M23 family metallopeptidase n=1 Tax=Psychroflexus aurantiacus TaxID=2709310 RepID=A0A6B3R5T9_9FLAO|nr:M23 family metallopeptidase [Psychroflexus aurantiacus]NEV94405.1 M23 family metallopeptidase [Psychroflexus aurantiacus]